MIGMKLSSKIPFKFLNPIIELFYKKGGIDTHRDIITCIKSKFDKIDYYEECFFGFYYILGTSKQR